MLKEIELYIIIFFTSPFIANFYDQPILIPIFRVLGFTLFFGAVNSIQQAVVARKLEFKKYFFVHIYLSTCIRLHK